MLGSLLACSLEALVIDNDMRDAFLIVLPPRPVVGRHTTSP